MKLVQKSASDADFHCPFQRLAGHSSRHAITRGRRSSAHCARTSTSCSESVDDRYAKRRSSWFGLHVKYLSVRFRVCTPIALLHVRRRQHKEEENELRRYRDGDDLIGSVEMAIARALVLRSTYDLKDHTDYSSILWFRMREIRGSTANLTLEHLPTNGRVNSCD